MNKIYHKNEVSFAIIMIVIYVIGTIISETISEIIGISKLIPAIFHVLFSLITAVWIVKNGHTEKYGLTLPKYKLARAGFFVPLIIVACSGLLFGIKLNYGPLETVLFVISMCCVGFLEEILFRGFLFVGMAQKNVNSAVIVASLTFGIGHIVNLLNGQDLVKTIFQIVFAIAVGFALVILFYKGKSLIPCIVFHSLNNSLSAFEKDTSDAAKSLLADPELFEMICVIIYIAILTIYSFFLLKKLNVSQE